MQAGTKDGRVGFFKGLVRGIIGFNAVIMLAVLLFALTSVGHPVAASAETEEAASGGLNGTVAMAAVRLERDRAGGWIQSWRRRLTLGCGLAATVAVGYAAVWMPFHRQKQQQLRDIPVVQDMDLYLHAESVEFLRQLEQEDLFAEDFEDAL